LQMGVRELIYSLGATQEAEKLRNDSFVCSLLSD
jgi:hypothetical protein